MTPSEHELYEFVTHGETHGPKTMGQGVDFLDHRSVHRLSDRPLSVPKRIGPPELDVHRPMDELVAQVTDQLLTYFHQVKENFGDSVC